MDFLGGTCVKNLPIMIAGLERPLRKGMATHSGILAWRIPWMLKRRQWKRRKFFHLPQKKKKKKKPKVITFKEICFASTICNRWRFLSQRILKSYILFYTLTLRSIYSLYFLNYSHKEFWFNKRRHRIFYKYA